MALQQKAIAGRSLFDDSAGAVNKATITNALVGYQVMQVAMALMVFTGRQTQNGGWATGAHRCTKKEKDDQTQDSNCAGDAEGHQVWPTKR